MNKEQARKEFIKLKLKGHSYNQCRGILRAKHGFMMSKRTLIRWNQRFETTDWNLRDNSTRPHILHYKITPAIEQEVIQLRKQTG